MTWLSVENKLPDNGDYRVCKNHQLTFIGMNISGKCWFFVCPINKLMYAFGMNLPDPYTAIDVTHWQEIPKD